jgi:predicted metal-binding membrane protein
MGQGMGMGLSSIISSLDPVFLGTFLLLWVVGMAAMMFPAMIPVVAFYDRVVTKGEPNPGLAKAVGTPLFLLGYLAAYGGLGLLAYLGLYELMGVTAAVPIFAQFAFVGPTIVLFLAGIYQFSGLKVRAMASCISPFGFFATRMKSGLFGSLQMGLTHGLYCVACCWAFMLVMLAVALMSIPFMAVIAGVIILEKVIVRGARWFRWGVGFAFFALGMVVLYVPGLLTFSF